MSYVIVGFICLVIGGLAVYIYKGRSKIVPQVTKAVDVAKTVEADIKKV
jgi:hypothetical protein